MTSFHVGRTIQIGELGLRVIEKTSVDHQLGERGVFVQGRKEPYAVVVQRAGVSHAIGVDGAPMSISRLSEEVPEVAASEKKP